MDKNEFSILCIEDDEDTCELLEFIFKNRGCEVETCSNQNCLDLIEKKSFSAVVLDNYFGNLSGIEICRRIRALNSSIPVIFYSGEVRQTEINKAFAAGATAYLKKPNDFEMLVETTFRLIAESEGQVI